MNHLSVKVMLDCLLGETLPKEAKQHLETCAECGQKIASLQESMKKGLEEQDSKPCVTVDANQIAAYVDHQMSSAEKSRFEKHLFSCSTCLASVRDLMCDMSAFGLEPLKAKNILQKKVGAVIRVVKKGLDLVMNNMSRKPVFAYAAAVRGSHQKSILQMKWSLKKGSKQYEVVLKYVDEGEAELFMNYSSSKPCNVSIKLFKDSHDIETKMFHLDKKKKESCFGVLSKGKYVLKEQESDLMGFSLE